MQPEPELQITEAHMQLLIAVDQSTRKSTLLMVVDVLRTLQLDYEDNEDAWDALDLAATSFEKTANKIEITGTPSTWK